MKSLRSIVMVLVLAWMPAYLTAAPTVTITSPAANATFSSPPATINVAASVGGGGVSVEFHLDGVTVGKDTSANGGFTCTLPAMPPGQYTLLAVAADSAGVTGTSSSVTFVVAGESPVLHWKLDEVYGPLAYDASGNGNDGTIRSTTTMDAGDSIGCDGTVNSGVICYDVDNFPTTAITAACWVKTSDTANTGTLISYAIGSGPNSDNEFAIFNTKNLEIHVKGIQAWATKPINDGKWHHVAATWQASDKKVYLYIDGAQVYQSSINAAPMVPGGCLVIGQEQDSLGGGFAPNQALNGLIRDVRIYNRALNQTEVQAIVAATRPPVLYWKLAEASGTSALDGSGHANNGTLLPSSTWEPGGGVVCTSTTTSGIVKSGVNAFPSSAITASFFIKTSDTVKNGTPLSYAVSGGSFNEFTIFNQRSFQIHLKGSVVNTNVAVNDGAWHHVAVTWRNSDGIVKVYKDGIVAATDTCKVAALAGNGYLVAGQEQDAYGGGFDSNQALNGSINKIRIYDRVLEAEEIAALSAPVAEDTDISATQTSSAISLENPFVSVTFNTQNKGVVTSFYDKEKAIEFITSGGNALFTLDFLDATGTATQSTLSSSTASGFSASITESSGSKRTVQLNYTFTNPAVSVVCLASVYENDPLVHWKVDSITFPTSMRLGGVRFPICRFVTPLNGDGSDDAAVFGATQGGIRRPAAWQTYGRSKVEQPGTLAAQFGCYYDATAGIYIAALDSKGYPKNLEIYRCTDNGVEMPFEPRFFETASGYYSMPYDIVMGTFNGGANSTDWRYAADIYKAWAIQQPWCAVPYAQRGDIPSWAKEGSAYARFDFASGTNSLSVNAAQLAGWVDSYWKADSNLSQAPLITGIWGWEHVAPWIGGPEYFPPSLGESEFSSYVSNLRSKGCHVGAWPSGYNWARSYNGTFPNFEWENYAAFDAILSHAVLNLDGTPRIVTSSTTVATWLRGGDMGSVCAADPWTRDWLNTSVCARLAGYGCEMIQVDQMVGGRIPVCFSSSHPHSPGSGKWMADAFKSQLLSMRVSLGSVIFTPLIGFEEPNEHFLNYIGIQDYRNCQFPGEWADVFNYLYHEYVPTFQSGLNGSVIWTAHCLVNGQMPYVVPTLSGTAPNNLLFKKWVALYRTYPKYLVHGTMQHPPSLTTSGTVTINNVVLPAVMHNAFRASDGAEAVVLANASGVQQTATLNWHGIVRTVTLPAGDATLIE